MKKRELKQLQENIFRCKDLQGSTFAYTCVVNDSLIKTELEAINSAKIKPSKEVDLFIKAQQNIIESFVKRDKNKELMILTSDNGSQTYNFELGYKIPMMKQLKDLEDNSKKEIDELNVINEDFEKLMDQEINSNLVLLNKNDLPVNISVEALAGLFNILVVEENKIKEVK